MKKIILHILEKKLKPLKKLFISNKLPHTLLFRFSSILEYNYLIDLSKLIFSGVTESNNDIHISRAYNLSNKSETIDPEELKENLDSMTIASSSSTKLFIILAVEELSAAVSNILLNIMENPPKNSYFIFFSYNLELVAPILLSRCVIADIRLAHEEKIFYLQSVYKLNNTQIKKALLISRGSLHVIDRIKTEKNFWIVRKNLFKVLKEELNIFAISDKFNEHYQDVLYWLNSFIIDVYYLGSGVKPETLANFDKLDAILYILDKHTLFDIYSIYQEILRINYFILKDFNINKQLALESLLLRIIWS